MKFLGTTLALLIVGTLITGTVSAKQSDAYTVCPQIQFPIDRLACFDSYTEEALALKTNLDEIILASINPVALLATNATDQSNGTSADSTLPPARERLLTSDGPNHIRIVQPGSNSGLRDDKQVEINMAFKYPVLRGFIRHLNRKVPEEKQHLVPDNIYFAYRGEFDFYALGGSRYDSSPIVVRNQVPGFALEWRFGEDDKRSLRFGAFHQSNGQSLNDKPSKLDERFTVSDPNAEGLSPCQQMIAGEEFQSFNIGRQRYNVELCRSGSPDFALAQVSRAYNYWQLRYGFSSTEELYADDLYRYSIELRTYDDTHDEIFWDPTDRSQIEDYDGLRLSMDKAFRFLGKTPLLFRGELKAGTSSLDALGNLGGKVSLGVKLPSMLTSLFYFDGYGKEPSTYHLRTQHWGLEFELR